DRARGGAGPDSPAGSPDLLYDGSPYGRGVVLVARDGTRATLPAGGAVKTVIAVPDGWVLTRVARDGTDSGQFVDRTGRLLQQSDRIEGMAVNATGTRAAAHLQDGKIRIWDLTHNADAVKETRLPAGVRVAGWVGDRVLLRLPGTGSYSRYDYWDPGLGEYRSEPGDESLRALGGRSDGRTLVALGERDGQPCLVLVDVAKRFRPVSGPHCGDPVRLAPVAPGDLLPLVSPDGRTLLARTPSGEAATFAVDDVIAGTAKAAVLGSLGADPVVRVNWAAGAVFAQTPDRYLHCRTGAGGCVEYEPATEDGLPPTRLVIRFPV
ncbi:MAG TPA: hypothetical protein VFR67_13730, partial [Pilimelia sp.]|nr:hypothetical protein [Pilimelia sp.]